MASGEAEGDRWDFFVSYTQADRQWAEWIAWTLEEAEYEVLIQAWDFVPGANWVAGMDAGVRRAARTIAVLSAKYQESVYGTAEWQAAWAGDPLGARQKLLVARVEDCSRPGLLGQVVSFDHGCGAHSEVVLAETSEQSESLSPVLDTMGFDDVP